MEDCIFCKIIKREIPAGIFYENDQVLAFLDIAPCSFGHALVIPKKHCQNILDCPPEILNVVTETARVLTPRLLTATGATGLNITSNNGAVAGQIVGHLHWHLIPRYDNDGLKLWPKNETITNEQNQELLAKLLG